MDKSGLASQTWARAAGLAQQVRVDDVLAALAIRGVRTLTSLQALTGRMRPGFTLVALFAMA